VAFQRSLAANVLAVIEQVKASGAMSLRAIAKAVNALALRRLAAASGRRYK
jgi:hypothetical protein